MKTIVVFLLILSFVICNVNCFNFDKAPECAKHGVYSACPENCEKYYMCFQGRLLKFRCQWGLHWNNKLRLCDMPAEANCNENSDSTIVTLPPVETIQPIVTEVPATESAVPADFETPTNPAASESRIKPPVAAKKEKNMKVVCYCKWISMNF